MNAETPLSVVNELRARLDYVADSQVKIDSGLQVLSSRLAAIEQSRAMGEFSSLEERVEALDKAIDALSERLVKIGDLAEAVGLKHDEEDVPYSERINELEIENDNAVSSLDRHVNLFQVEIDRRVKALERQRSEASTEADAAKTLDEDCGPPFKPAVNDMVFLRGDKWDVVWTIKKVRVYPTDPDEPDIREYELQRTGEDGKRKTKVVDDRWRFPFRTPRIPVPPPPPKEKPAKDPLSDALINHGAAVAEEVVGEFVDDGAWKDVASVEEPPQPRDSVVLAGDPGRWWDVRDTWVTDGKRYWTLNREDDRRTVFHAPGLDWPFVERAPYMDRPVDAVKGAPGFVIDPEKAAKAVREPPLGERSRPIDIALHMAQSLAEHTADPHPLEVANWLVVCERGLKSNLSGAGQEEVEIEMRAAMRERQELNPGIRRWEPDELAFSRAVGAIPIRAKQVEVQS